MDARDFWKREGTGFFTDAFAQMGSWNKRDSRGPTVWAFRTWSSVALLTFVDKMIEIFCNPSEIRDAVINAR
eukprot:5670850-Karenia_brevis.AAC.1